MNNRAATNLATAYDATRGTDYTVVRRAYLIVDAIDSARVCTRGDDLDGYVHLRACLDGLCDAVHGEQGRLVKTLGDGLEACFEDPLRALSCALTIARSAEGGPFPGVRVALAWGELIEYTVDERLDYFGRAVIVAARIARLGSRSGVFMSPAFVSHARIATFLGGLTLDRERASLKGIADPVNIYAIYARGHGARRRTAPDGVDDRAAAAPCVTWSGAPAGDAS